MPPGVGGPLHATRSCSVVVSDATRRLRQTRDDAPRAVDDTHVPTSPEDTMPNWCSREPDTPPVNERLAGQVPRSSRGPLPGQEAANLLRQRTNADRFLEIAVEPRSESALAVLPHRESRHRDDGHVASAGTLPKEP